jgi:hypothetical protein
LPNDLGYRPEGVTRLTMCMTEGRARWADVEPQATGRRVMEQPTRFIGMDVHKATIAVAITATGEVGKAGAGPGSDRWNTWTIS